ncbi:MAG: hypothetical protein ACYSWO_29500 [Planctomycetota bacterium]|jgi:hypothetical protein
MRRVAQFTKQDGGRIAVNIFSIRSLEEDIERGLVLAVESGDRTDRYAIEGTYEEAVEQIEPPKKDDKEPWSEPWKD